MNNDIAISIRNLTKSYKLYKTHAERVKETFHPFRKKYHETFNALSNISIDIKKGESVGVIGRNGSGKSTMLQIISRILTPTSGSVDVQGRISALLELGAGFNPEFTGKENVYLNMSILGFSRKKIDAKYPEIKDFADIGEFIDKPVKIYSSGMYVRLAFAVQACVEPEILIIDEALSVGDFFFQQKCMKRMLELRQNRATLIFVSHDVSMVRDLCDKAVYLKNGRMIFFGLSQKAIQLYYQEVLSPDQLKKNQECEKDNSTLTCSSPVNITDSIKKEAIWTTKNENKSNGLEAKLIAISVLNSENEMTLKARIGEKIKFKVLYKTYTDEPIHVSISLKNRYNQVINSNGSYISEIEPLRLMKGAYAIFEFQLTCMIELGFYSFYLNLSKTCDLPNRGVTLDETPWLGPLAIDWDYENEKAPFLGMFDIPFSDAKFISVSENTGKGAIK